MRKIHHQQRRCVGTLLVQPCGSAEEAAKGLPVLTQCANGEMLLDRTTLKLPETRELRERCREVEDQDIRAIVNNCAETLATQRIGDVRSQSTPIKKPGAKSRKLRQKMREAPDASKIQLELDLWGTAVETHD